MRLLEFRAYPGPSLYAPRPVVAIVIDMGENAAWTVASFDPGRRAELGWALPALDPAALADSTPLADLYAQLVAALQTQAGRARATAWTLAVNEAQVRVVICSYESAPLAQQAALVGASLVEWLSGRSKAGGSVSGTLDPSSLIGRLEAQAATWLLDQTTGAPVKEAERRGIPWFRVLESDRLVQLGQGRFRARLRETLTDHTTSIASSLTRSKRRTHLLLAELALPTTRQEVAGGEEHAVAMAERIGYPVVIKPEDRSKSIAVSIGLKDRDEVIAGYRKARAVSQLVLVEAVVPGEDHRVLVVNGKMVAVSKRVAAHVFGDGRSTVEELVEVLNRDPRRGVGFTKALVRIDLDDDLDRMLAKVGLTRVSVPPPGQRVVLRGAASISAGGTAVDVTREVHPDNRIAAERAACALGVDIVGVDFMTRDIRLSWRDVGGAILELNTSPGLRPHWAAEGSPDVTAAVMDSIVPPGAKTRIPIAAITGSNGKTTTTNLTAHILGINGRIVGMATTERVRIGSDTVAHGDFAGISGAKIVLQDPRVEAAALETSRRGILRRGVYFDWCDVAAVMSIGTDHVGIDGINSKEDLAKVKRLVVAQARRMAVLNADDPLCVGLAAGLTAARLCYVSYAPDNPHIRRQIDTGAPAVWLDETGSPRIALFDGASRYDLISIADLPIAMGGAARYNVRNAMFASALTFGLGESLETIRQGLRTFSSDRSSNPGRFNRYDGLPFSVYVENAANPEAFAATADFANRLAVQGRRILVLWSQGNKIDGMYPAIARAVAGRFDHYVCTEPTDTRGRPKGDIIARLQAGLREAGVRENQIDVVPTENDAVVHALKLARPGDLLIISVRKSEHAWPLITSFKPSD